MSQSAETPDLDAEFGICQIKRGDGDWEDVPLVEYIKLESEIPQVMKRRLTLHQGATGLFTFEGKRVPVTTLFNNGKGVRGRRLDAAGNQIKNQPFNARWGGKAYNF